MRERKGGELAVGEQALAACGPLPEVDGAAPSSRSRGRVQIFSFRQHDEGEVASFKGTAKGIGKYMMGTPIAGTGEEVDASLLDAEGFYRDQKATKPSSSTS